MILTEIAPIDEILGAHRAGIGKDFVGYRNHVYRVANLSAALTANVRDTERLEKIAIAAAFHDLGIWTDRTFDYLAPSVRLAADYLNGSGRSGWTAGVSEMILQHHKVTPFRGGAGLVEPFRKADWIDVTWSVVSFGLPGAFVRELYAEWPDAGFHLNLVRLEIQHLGKHPLNPLPMFRW